VLVHIFNDCDDIDLIGRQCTIFKGREKSDKFDTVTPGNQDKVIIVSSKALLGRAEGCILYEIVKHKDHQVPLIRDSRIFMAIGVLISPHQVNERKVTVKLISVKSHESTETKLEARNLYKNVLRHSMHTRGQDSLWNLEKLGLNLEVDFDRGAQAKLIVRLSRLDVLPDNMPISYS
jgi:hypothetical protein